MENESVKMEDVMNIGIGEDKPQTAPKRVGIEAIKIEPVNSTGKHIGDKLVLVVKHPDLKEPIDLSSVKYEKAGKLTTSGLWIKMDTNNQLFFHSAIACMLRYYNLKSLKDLKGMTMDTVVDDKGYLAIKAY